MGASNQQFICPCPRFPNYWCAKQIIRRDFLEIIFKIYLYLFTIKKS